jgi:putative transposase
MYNAFMPEYHRIKRAGGTYFFTLVTEGRKRILTLASILPLLKASYEYVQDKDPFKLEAYVLLPDHIHCLVTLPFGDDAYSMRIMKFKKYFTLHAAPLLRDCLADRSESKVSKREGGVWQRRFWEHCIRDEADLQRHSKYIAYNPVKHEYVTTSEEWPYCYVLSSLRVRPDHKAEAADMASDWRDLQAGE